MEYCCSDTLRFLLRAQGLFAPTPAKLATTYFLTAYLYFTLISPNPILLKQSLRRSCHCARPYESLVNRHYNSIHWVAADVSCSNRIIPDFWSQSHSHQSPEDFQSKYPLHESAGQDASDKLPLHIPVEVSSEQPCLS